MPRYIDTEKIRLYKGFFEKIDNVPKFYEWLETLPTADVVEVVRCRDCKHCKLIEKDSDVRYCYCHHMFHFEDYYCADGKRKETEDE